VSTALPIVVQFAGVNSHPQKLLNQRDATQNPLQQPDGCPQTLNIPNWDSQLIIVSESSAEATRRVRTGRYTLAHSRSSAAQNDTPRYREAREISVHTEVLSGVDTGG
jgi:hypothetical protein